MKRLLFSLLLVGILSNITFAQDTDRWLGPERTLSRWLGSVYLDGGIASNIFAQNMKEKHGFGLGGELMYSLKKEQPLWAGFGVHSFSFDDYRLSYSQEFDGILYTYEDHTVSRLFFAHGIVRFQPEVRFFLQPYIQAAAGVNWFYTNTKIRDLDLDEQVDRINESRDAVLGFALHCGVQIVPRMFPDFRADLRVGYFTNASVEYMRFNPALTGGVFTANYFETKKSPVDMIGLHIGITVVIRTD